MRGLVLVCCLGCARSETSSTASEDARAYASPASARERSLWEALRSWLAGPSALGRGTLLMPNRDEDEALVAPYDSSETGDSGEAADDGTIPNETDVLVIGSGPAGMAAALAARELGAEVLVLDRADQAGEGIIYGGRFFAAGTPHQAALGLADSADIAASEWESITGVDGSAPAVQAFLAAAAETLTWMEGHGLAVEGVNSDPDGGELRRIHNIDGASSRRAILAGFDGDLHVQVQVDALLTEEGRVVGARWTDLATGELGTTTAGALVVATGGFLRDAERIVAWRPELDGRRLMAETNPQSDGGGLAFLEEVGAAFDHMDSIGIYVHGIQDPYAEDGEALVLSALDDELIVDANGERFADEAKSRSLDLFDALPDGEVYALFTDARAAAASAGRPAYNWAEPEVPESYTLDALVTDSPDIFVAASLSELALASGIDETGLIATVDAVNAMIEAAETDVYGRDFTRAERYESDLWWALRLTPGLAKAFGGVSADLEMQVLDADGEAIPGLYAAGEVVGMIPQGGAGAGFAGSVGACYTLGREAGTNAATLAISAR